MRRQTTSRILLVSYLVLFILPFISILVPQAKGTIMGSQPPALGNWNIAQDTLATDEIITIVNGSVLINAPYSLTLIRTTLQFDVPATNTYLIRPYSGGTLNITDHSTIKSINSNKWQKIYVEGKIYATGNSIIRDFQVAITILANAYAYFDDVEITNFDTGAIATIKNSHDNIFRNLKIHGARASSVGGFSEEGFDNTYENIEVYDLNSTGADQGISAWCIGTAAGDYYNGTTWKNIRIHDLHCESNGAARGMRIIRGRNYYFENVTAINIQHGLSSGYGYGFVIGQSGVASNNITLQDCVAYNCKTYGILVDGVLTNVKTCNTYFPSMYFDTLSSGNITARWNTTSWNGYTEITISRTTNNNLGMLSWSFASNKLIFTVSAPSGQTSTTQTFVGEKGQPKSVFGASSWSYNAASQTVTATIIHSSPARILISWKFLGDIDGDNDVDANDLYFLGVAYGSQLEDPNYNSNSDIDCDGDIDADDLYMLAENYGKY